MRTYFSTLLILLIGVSSTQAQKRAIEWDPDKKALRKEKREARKASTDTYMMKGTLLNWFTIQDTRATSNVYGAPGLGFLSTDIKRRPGVIQYFDNARLQYGFMTALAEGSSGHLGRYTGGYSQVRQIKNASRWDTYFGGGVYAQYTGRFLPELSNSLYHHDLTGALRIRGEVEREFRLRKKNLILQYRLQIPLVAYVNRWPEFGLSLRGPAEYIAPVGVWNQVISEISLEGWLSERNDNRWRLSYQWDWYSFAEDIHSINVASHAVSFAYLIHK